MPAQKIVANVISNPNIRFLLICGKEIKGHKSGESLKALHEFGIGEDNRIINAPGAIPYIENLKKEAIKRFQDQIEILDLINIIDKVKINNIIKKYISINTKSFGKPYIAIRFKKIKNMKLDDKRALHSRIKINYLGKIEKRN